jgi:hypothetical protein
VVGVLLGALLLAVGERAAAQLPPGDVRLTPREQQDLLEPLSLEPARGNGPPPPVVPRPPPAAPADTTGGRAAIGGPAPTPGPQLTPGTPPAPAAADSSEQVTVVRLRAVLVGGVDQAQRLVEMLRDGAKLEAAQRALGGLEIDEMTRDMALEDLQPSLRAELEKMRKGGWTNARPWRERAAIFQLVSQETRRRSTLPKLGDGLDAQEQSRLASLHHPMPKRAPRVDNADADQNLVPAAVVQQERPAYPTTATMSGDVTVEVKIGLLDDVVDAKVTSSTDPIFEAPALEAARHSTYHSARRSGVPETGTLRLTFRFVAPNAASGDSLQH